jgi:hypothetical protein
MSKGQQAMAVAMIYLEPAKTKRKRFGSSGARIYFSCLCRRQRQLK